MLHDKVRQIKLCQNECERETPFARRLYDAGSALTLFAYSMRAQHGLHPLVSLRMAMYDSRSGMLPDARSFACWVTAWKKSSKVSMNLF